jgi:hypothetical protein
MGKKPKQSWQEKFAAAREPHSNLLLRRKVFAYEEKEKKTARRPRLFSH